MNYLIDTCVVSDFFKKIPSVVTHFESISPRQIHISTITAMEIEYGLKLNPEREKKIRPIWESLLEQIQLIPLSHKCAIAAASFRAQLKTIGMPIGPYDVLIAGTASSYDLIIVTANLKEFNRLPGVIIENWRE